MRTTYSEEKPLGQGAYVLQDAADAQATIFASGSEVEIAVKAKSLLADKGIAARVVSVPSFELFEAQSEEYKASVLGSAKVKVGVEAAIRQGWTASSAPDGVFIGMKGFGASGPYKELTAISASRRSDRPTPSSPSSPDSFDETGRKAGLSPPVSSHLVLSGEIAPWLSR